MFPRLQLLWSVTSGLLAKKNFDRLLYRRVRDRLRTTVVVRRVSEHGNINETAGKKKKKWLFYPSS